MLERSGTWLLIALAGLAQVPPSAPETLPATQPGSPAAMLARIKDPHAGVALVDLLEHEDEAVRKAGATALEQMAGVLDTDTASALVALLPTTQEGEFKRLLTHLIGAIPTAVIPLCAMLKHPDAERQVAAATMLDQLLDRSEEHTSELQSH